MSAVRNLIAAALTAHLVDVDVEPYAKPVEGLTRPLVMLRLDTITRTPQAGRNTRRYGPTVLVVSHLTDDDPAGHDAVDELVEDVLYAIDQAHQLTWTEARRVTVDETWPGWEVDLLPIPTKYEPTTQEGTAP